MIPTQAHRVRIITIATLLIAGLVGLGFRLYDLQVIRHEKLAALVNKQNGRTVKTAALRGGIFDCNDNILAHSVPVHTVVVDPKFVRDEELRHLKAKKPSQVAELTKLLSDELAMPLMEVRQRLDESGRYAVLKRKVSEETALVLKEELKQKGLRGVRFEDDEMRLYPNGSLMSHVIGYVNSEQRGMDGVEVFAQKDLQGQDGWRHIEVDNRGREIVVYSHNEDFLPARNGFNIILTLDQTIQNIVEQELDAVLPKYQPDSAVVIVMRPTTGEILAMASRPTFDPNAGSKKVDSLRNRAVSDLNEPGSTFKIITLAAALDQRLVTLNDTIFCENGKFLYGGRYLTDHEPYGNLTVSEGIEKSSNILAAKLGLMLGDQRMYMTARAFGIGEKAFGDIDGERWPCEVRGTLHPTKEWTKVTITRVAMGHGVSVTPLQTVAAMCAIANGGNLMRPQIVKRVTDSKGTTVREFFPQVRRRVIDQRAAHLTTEALKQVVSKDGTALKAAIPGFVVAGKTGTAQKWIDGAYSHVEFVSSFSGFFPANDPELCVYVMFDNPKGKDYYGGAVAAPVFHDISVRVASYLNLRPSAPNPRAVEPRSSLVRVSNSRRLPR